MNGDVTERILSDHDASGPAAAGEPVEGLSHSARFGEEVCAQPDLDAAVEFSPDAVAARRGAVGRV